MDTQNNHINILKNQINDAKHIITLNKGIRMIALVQSCRGTTHINPEQ